MSVAKYTTTHIEGIISLSSQQKGFGLMEEYDVLISNGFQSCPTRIYGI